jgi:hypothetical protein
VELRIFTGARMNGSKPQKYTDKAPPQNNSKSFSTMSNMTGRSRYRTTTPAFDELNRDKIKPGPSGAVQAR